MKSSSPNPKRMIPFVAACAAVSLALAGSVAGTAGAASELGVNKAKAATAKWAAQDCSQNPDCVKSDARYCDRQSDFKLVCVAFTIERRGTERVQCRTQVVVTGKPDG